MIGLIAFALVFFAPQIFALKSSFFKKSSGS